MASFDGLGQCERAFVGRKADDVADPVAAGKQRGVAVAGQGHEHEGGRPLQVVGQRSESRLAIHVERGSAVEFENPIALGSSDRQ